jgi:phage terminase large subunit
MPVMIPHGGWLPRPHQRALWEYLQSGGLRAMAVWHRRAGKDEICLHHAAASMMRRRGNYWHCLPEYSQGRKAIWTAVNAHTGKRRIDEAFPPELRETINENEMFIRINGSTWQVIGSDTYNSTVGSGAAGITFSEYALSNPAAWGYFRPMLEENNGWAAFITTPRGRNHAKALFDHAQAHPHQWFSERLTALDTGALSSTQLEEALAEYQALYGHDVGRAQFQQEYMVDWNAAVLGAFYAFEMAQVRSENRVLPIEAIPGQPVHRAWDLGVTDDTSIWWYQQVGAQLFILDHYAASGVGLEHYRDVITARRREHGWLDGDDFVPHDAKIKEWGTGRTRVETMQSMGLNPVLVPMASVEDGRNAVRRTLPLCVFHPRTEAGGMDALEQHHREWNDETKAFRASAVHDWTSHPADSFRYLCQSWRRAILRVIREHSTLPEGWMIPPPIELHAGGIRL